MLLNFSLTQLALIHRPAGITHNPVHDRVAPRESLGATRLEAFFFGVTVKLTHHVFDADSQHHLAVFAPLDELTRRRPEW